MRLEYIEPTEKDIESMIESIQLFGNGWKGYKQYLLPHYYESMPPRNPRIRIKLEKLKDFISKHGIEAFNEHILPVFEE